MAPGRIIALIPPGPAGAPPPLAPGAPGPPPRPPCVIIICCIADPAGADGAPCAAAGAVSGLGCALPLPLVLVAVASISAVAEPPAAVDGAGDFSTSGVGAAVSSAGASSPLPAAEPAGDLRPLRQRRSWRRRSSATVWRRRGIRRGLAVRARIGNRFPTTHGHYTCSGDPQTSEPHCPRLHGSKFLSKSIRRNDFDPASQSVWAEALANRSTS